MERQTSAAYRHLMIYLNYHYKWYGVESPISGDELARLKAGHDA